jgi:hypothetical protein
MAKRRFGGVGGSVVDYVNVIPRSAGHPSSNFNAFTPTKLSKSTMPSKSRRISQKLVEQEGRLQLAISALKKNEIPSIRRAADIFDVPRSTLQDRLNGCQY